MAKLLTWREEWSLDIEPLDADHRALIGRFCDICLHYCPQAGCGKTLVPMAWLSGSCTSVTVRIPTLIDSLLCLGEEASAHFRREEAFMRAIGYERLDEHEAEHARLLANYRDMVAGWRLREAKVCDESIQESVREWLLDHIAGSDRAFADTYFRACGLDSRPPRFGTTFWARGVWPRRVSGRAARTPVVRDERDPGGSPRKS